MERARRLQIEQLGPELTCHLCKGYFVDAFTVVECLHSFCKSCIMEHVKQSCDCPTCGTQLNKARLASALRPDQTLQSVVYKLVPRLFNDEMQRRRDFYQDHPHRDRSLSPERRGDVSSQQFVHTLADPISFSLEFSRSGAEDDQKTDLPAVRYFQAPAGLSVSHLKKLLQLKHGLGAHGAQIDIMYAGDILSDELIIMDVAYMYDWDRTAPMRFSYRYTTKRPLGVDVPGPAASPSKRRCREPTAELQPGGDSDKENVENDARPMTTVTAAATAAATAVDSAPTAAAAAKPAVKPAEQLSRRPAVGAVHEAPREPVTSPVTSPRAEPGAAAAGPASAPTEPRPAACAGGEASGAVASGHQQTATGSAGRAGVANGEGTARAAAKGENSDVAKGGNSGVANGENSDVANGEKSGTTVAVSAKKSAVPANRTELSVVSNRARNSGVAEKTTTRHPAVSSDGEKPPRNASAKDSVMIASEETKDVDRRGTKRPSAPPSSAPQLISPKTDVPKSSVATNGIHTCPKQFHAAQSRPKITQIVPKPPSSFSSSGLTSKLSQHGGIFKHNAVSKPCVPQQAPKVASSDPVKGTAAQPQVVSKLGAPQNVLSSKTGPAQTGGIASLRNETNPSTQKPPSSATDIVPGPVPSQNGSVSKQSAPTKPHTPAYGPAQRDGAVASSSEPASIVTPAGSRSERTPGGCGGAVGGGVDPAPPADDRQCEDSGVDTDSSERPGNDSARSPIDVYDFDAEAEDETAVRLKVSAPTPEVRPAVRPPAATRMVPMPKVSRPAAVSTVEVQQASPGVRVTASVQRPVHPGVPVASVQRPLPPAAPAGVGQRPVTPSTPGVPLAQRPHPPSTPTVPPHRPTPPGAPAVSMQRPLPPSTPGVSLAPRPAVGPGVSLAPRPAVGPSVSLAPRPAVGPGVSLAPSPAMVPAPSAVPPSPRRSLAALPDLRPIGAGAIPLMTGQLERFLHMVSRSAVSQPNGSWRLPANAASSLLTRAAAPTQLAPGKPIQPKPVQGRPPGQTKPVVQARSGVQNKPVQPKQCPQPKPTATKQMSEKGLNQKYRLAGTQGIQNLVTNEITITKLPNASRAASASPGGRPAPPPPPAEPSRSPGSSAPTGRVTADGSVTIEKIRTAQPPPPPSSQSARPPNSPKLLAIAENLAMRKIQSQQRQAVAGGAASRSPASPAAAAGTPSAISSLISLSQTQQFHKQQQGAPEAGAPRGRPVASGSAARRQIPNPALLHHQSQGRLTVLNVPAVEAAGSDTATATGTTSASLARMERLTNSLGR